MRQRTFITAKPEITEGRGRTPIQWDDSPNAGFCAADVRPWMRVNDDYHAVNAKAQIILRRATDPVSPYRFWQRALQIRKEHAELAYGDFEVIRDTDPNVFAFKRTRGRHISDDSEL